MQKQLKITMKRNGNGIVLLQKKFIVELEEQKYGTERLKGRTVIWIGSHHPDFPSKPRCSLECKKSKERNSKRSLELRCS
uniref:Uncharacterized protein n=1 Tax=Oryza brachyantha TaxID=4533 RepID=J3M2H0_ORYBR